MKKSNTASARRQLFQDYEYQKGKIARTAESPEEYERLIKELAERLKL